MERLDLDSLSYPVILNLALMTVIICQVFIFRDIFCDNDINNRYHMHPTYKPLIVGNIYFFDTKPKNGCWFKV